MFAEPLSFVECEDSDCAGGALNERAADHRAWLILHEAFWPNDLRRGHLFGRGRGTHWFTSRAWGGRPDRHLALTFRSRSAEWAIANAPLLWQIQPPRGTTRQSRRPWPRPAG